MGNLGHHIVRINQGVLVAGQRICKKQSGIMKYRYYIEYFS